MSVPLDEEVMAPRQIATRHTPEDAPVMLTRSKHKKKTAAHIRELRAATRARDPLIPVPAQVPIQWSDSDPIASFMAERVYARGAKVTVGQALKGTSAKQWTAAIVAEVQQLMESGTLQETDESKLEEVRDVVHTTMQLKLKLHQDGRLDKFKARLCACGNELKGLIEETYSPTIGALAYATVLQMAIVDRMEMCTIDTVGAYLYQDYPTDAKALYLVLPNNVAQVCGLRQGAKYRVRKYLYGLPDAGRAYYKAYSSLLIQEGYTRTASDPCLFTRLTGSERTYVWCHVDDTFVCSTHKAGLLRFCDAVRKGFTITVSENIEEYLGIRMETQANGDVILSQPKLLDSLLEEFAEEIAALPPMRGVMTPQRPVEAQSTDASPMSQHEYLHLQGALIYLTKSRPDIMTAVSFGATHSAKPTRGAFQELLHCLRYLQESRATGLRLRAGVAHRDLVLTCYVDAGYLTHRDSKSHQGYCLSFSDSGMFYAKSSKQQLVATSSTHSEVRALYSLTADIVYVIHLCEELGRPIKLPAIVMEDNAAALAVTQDMTARVKRCKHFLMLVHYVKEQVEAGLILVRKVATAQNLADILTKIVTGKDFVVKAAALLSNPLHKA
jgi:hypothetical protein